MTIKCKHWSDCGMKGGGCCSHAEASREFGGTPSEGICLRVCSHYDGPSRGAGDKAKKVIDKLTLGKVKPCGGCKKRQQWMNARSGPTDTERPYIVVYCDQSNPYVGAPLRAYADHYGCDLTQFPYQTPFHGAAPRLDGAAMVFIWNGHQHGGQLVKEYCRRRGIPHLFLEFGLLGQKQSFQFDTEGFCSHSSMMHDLSWVTSEDVADLMAERDRLRRKYQPVGEDGDVLAIGQVPTDTQILFHCPYRSMQEFLDHLAEIMPNEPLRFRPHPQRADDAITSRSDEHVIEPMLPRGGEYLHAASKARLVVGITSTCLIEAAIMGIPTLALGDCPLRQHGRTKRDIVAAAHLARTWRHGADLPEWIERRFGIRPLVTVKAQ